MIIFLLSMGALLMNAIDQTIVATALDTLQNDLDAPIAWVAWTMTIYSLGMLIFVPMAGNLCEQFGHKRIFIGSVLLFTLASLACGLAGNIYVLVVLRFVQAIGAAGLYPAATGIIVANLGPARDRALGLFGSIYPIGAMIGPMLGGLFVTYGSWRAIFFVNVPIGLLLMLLALQYIPPDETARNQKPDGVDVVGMSQLGAGLLCGMFALGGLGTGTNIHWAAEVMMPGCIAAASFAFFARHIRVSKNPLIPARILVGRGFSSINAINFGGGIALGIVALLPLYATSRYGISALGSGMILAIEGLAALLGSSTAVLALRKSGYRFPIYTGLIAILAGIVLLCVPPGRFAPQHWLSWAAILMGFGMGWLSPASRNAGLQLAPERAPTIAALRTLCMQVGSIITISVTTAFAGGAAQPGEAHVWVYLGWGLLLLLMLPLVTHIPEHRGAW